MTFFSSNNSEFSKNIPKQWDMKSAEKVKNAIEALKQGHPILIIDDEIEGEGDVCIPAQLATPKIINFMATHCRGIICQPISPEMADRLDLPLMVPGSDLTPFTVSADAAIVGSGTSAYDRAKTAQVIADPHSTRDDIVRPGHIFPLRARADGVFERAGHTEASSDLVRLAGFTPSAVICEVMDKNGQMARTPELVKFAAQHNMPTVTVRDVINYRRQFDTPFLISNGNGSYSRSRSRSRSHEVLVGMAMA
ncbi:MAG: 3,4-dihydroxy-2-butanone-4-phosphate synthase [Anaerolineaceae bacterium 4572_78]|nr:MAG: 3,4-dihydroxy-2-butanone-4-phosphate synthase [Anaerolineaceae bacterium 4572_78]